MRKPFSSSIRSKLILLGMLAFLPVVLLTVFNAWHQRRLELAGSRERMEKILSFAVLNEEEVIRETERILAMLAEVPVVRGGGDRAGEFLARILKRNPAYTNIAIARPDGRVFASAVSTSGPSNFSDRPYFQEVLRNKSFSIGQYIVGRITGKPIVPFCYPVLDGQGKVTAVLVAAMDLSHVRKFEAGIYVQTPKNSTYVKLDSNGAVLSTYPASPVFRREQPLEKSLFDRISREKKGTFEAVGADGVERLYLFSPFRGPLIKEGGYALLGIPTKALFAEVDRVLARQLVVLAVVGGLFLAVVWFGGNALFVRPLSVLTNASRRMAAGDLKARAGLTSAQGEIGELGRAFDEMAEELQRRQDESWKMQETLRVSVAKAESEKAKTEAIIAGIGDGISIQDRDYRIIFQNQVLKNLVGDHVGEFCYKGYEGRNQDCEDCPLIVSFRDGRIHTTERTTTVNGKALSVEVTASPLKDGSGNIVAGIEVVRDVTERKRAEEALRLSEERFRVLSEQSPFGMTLIDRQGRYEYVNPTFVSMFGYTLNDVPTGADWFRVAFPDPEIREEVIRAWKEDLARSGVGEARLRTFDATCKNGARKSILFRSMSLSLDRQLVIYEDITRQRELQAQLQQAMKMEAVGRLAGGVAHDFNNLLTVIMGDISLALVKLSPSDPAGGLLADANKAAERAALLVRQLLAFSRKQIIEPKVLDLNILMADLGKMLVRLIGENIELKTFPGADLGLVKVDPGQFEQVLFNLVVNARDAMPEGGKLLIETANTDLDEEYCARHPYIRPGRFVMLAVSDTGHGMSEEVKKQIFEPFFTTKPKGTGTGLGLAMIYGVVKQSGGSIEVYSEVGKGTSFKIYLPRVEGEAAKPRESDLAMKLPTGSGTVLLVEDEEMVRNLGVRILERSGYRVMHAGNGDEAIAMAMGYGERIDLLLTDVVMPGMSGSELANRLTRIHPETRVLFTSGYTDNAIVHQGVLDEDVSFIGKPYSPSALAKKVREVLNRA